ncbi:hypothetical protein Salat_1547000 [Sesamum alatum]|uniref:Myb/SANT-like domain-containing protein n=1 Tax=Sesamum alatum TaxID=300844 RepID=A0AAE1YCM9_9LAMI|nr:hypothetical protein Salat_1547000 [Sesamum alatum]
MATPPQFRPQKRWFYNGRWTKSHDVAFINALCWRAEKGFTQDNPRRPNKNALLFAGRAVTRMWGWQFKEETYAWHLERLRERYYTFKSILHNPAFEWDRENNIVHAPFDEWVALIRDSLKLIFERNQAGGRATENEIVAISSGESDDDSDDADEDDEDTLADRMLKEGN